MKHLVGLALVLAAFAGVAQEQEIQRALIQRDQQSAEFAARLRSSQEYSALQELHSRQLLDAARPLHPDAEISRQLRPYQRQQMTDERALVLAPPVPHAKPPERPASQPLPLPGGPRHGVDPIPAQGPGH
jgi:hypothetical protein